MLVRTSAAVVADAAYRGMQSGKGSPTEISYAGDCQKAVYMYLDGRPDPTLEKLGIPQLGRTTVHMYVRCRKCAPCLKARSRQWAARATAETLSAKRTWFVTLTLSPDRATQARYASDRAMQLAISDRGDPANQFKGMVDFVSPEITRFLKRLRKNSGARLRYILVAEAHKSGIPHWHALIHEYDGTATKRDVQDCWRYGFSQVKLVDGNAAKTSWYVCKYVSKDALNRIRASKNYGDAQPDHIADLVKQIAGYRREPGRHASPGKGTQSEDKGTGTHKTAMEFH